MSDCCQNTPLDLGCVGFCDTISTGVNAPSTGTYVISLVGAGGYASYDFTNGEEITFTNPFNEDAVAVFQILKDGSPVTSGIYDCFQVKVNAGVNLAQVEEGGENTFNVYYNGFQIDSFSSSDDIVTINIYA